MPSSLPLIRTVSIFTSTTSARSALSFSTISERSAIISARSEFTLPFTEKNMLITSARVVSETPKIATSALIRGICEALIPKSFVSDAMPLASFRAAIR